MKKISALIIDDEKLAREGILERLKKFPEIIIEGESGDGEKAVRLINSGKPDLVFLDIQMPELNGFQVLEKIKTEKPPYIIFITAYDSYAVKAFEVNALDYLLKPIDTVRFNAAVDKAIQRIQNDELIDFSNNIKSLLHNETIEIKPANGKIPVREKGQIILIEQDEIFSIEAAGDYIYIYTNLKKHLLRETLCSIGSKLDKSKFVRVHRSKIVNTEKIKALKPCERGDYLIYLLNGSTVKLSRNYKSEFEKLLNTII